MTDAPTGRLDRKGLFTLWAPPAALWSPWAKPVAFAPTQLTPAPGPLLAIDISWAPPARETAILLDLPGADAVYAGLALVAKGYRPVPLYNAAYGPAGVINMHPISNALWHGASTLQRSTLPPDAPPVFLLDRNRMADGRPPRSGFDNRWMTFPQDFPSANLLLSRGITQAILFQGDAADLRYDLAHVLRRWQDAGITLLGLNHDSRLHHLHVPKPSLFRTWWYVAISICKLRRNSAGGFGAAVPIPTESSGWG